MVCRTSLCFNEPDPQAVAPASSLYLPAFHFTVPSSLSAASRLTGFHLSPRDLSLKPTRRPFFSLLCLVRLTPGLRRCPCAARCCPRPHISPGTPPSFHRQLLIQCEPFSGRSFLPPSATTVKGRRRRRRRAPRVPVPHAFSLPAGERPRRGRGWWRLRPPRFFTPL